MATSLVTRVRRLEDAAGDGECPRCSGMVVVLMDGEFSGAGKHGREMTEEEYREFEAEEDDEGRCPACGRKSTEITVGWPEDAA